MKNFNMKSISFFSGVVMFFGAITSAQTKTDSLKKNLENYVNTTDLKFENQLVSDEAYNLFQQKKTSYYLTGASEVSLSKVYATYSSEQDKFNFGVNFKVGYKEKDLDKADRSKNQLQWLFTPLMESNIKKSFTTLYEKGKWNSDIRVGGKINYFFKGKLNYPGMDISNKDQTGNIIYSHQETNLIIIRNLKLAKILKSIDSLEMVKAESEKSAQSVVGQRLESLKKIASNNPEDDRYVRTKSYLEMITSNENMVLNQLIDKNLDKPKSLDDYKNQIADAEVNELYKANSYNCFRNYWISIWGFYPITEEDTYISTGTSQNFTAQKLKLWEVNAQGNMIFEKNNKFSFYGALGFKVFSNNSAISNSMTLVDYYQYEQYAPTAYNNLAVIENNKAYIGTFEEFTTTNMNLLLVLSLPNTNSAGKERFLTPGISLFTEKNIGQFHAMNLRVGIPLRFRGKSTPINIEPQIILRDINNYSKKTDYSLKPVIGINVGLPFTALYK